MIGVLAGALLTGCWSTDTVDSEDVDEDEIYAEYSVNFYEDTAELEFFVQFRLGGATGTTLRLTSPSQVTADGDVMQLRDGEESVLNLIGSYYDLDKSASAGAPAAEYSFVWTRTDGTKYENIVPMARPIAILAPTADAMVSKSMDLVIEFDAAAGPAEEVVCSIDGVEGYTSNTVTAGNTCVLTPSELAELMPGPATLAIHREHESSATNGHESTGGDGFARYYGLEVEVTVVD